MPYVSGLVNGIQARENHKSVNGMQLNGIRVWQMHCTGGAGGYINIIHSRFGATHTTPCTPRVVCGAHACLRGLHASVCRGHTQQLARVNPRLRKWHTGTQKP